MSGVAPSCAVEREFCRRLFRVGGATALLRHAFLDALADSALAAQVAGSAVSATSTAGTSVDFQFFAGWEPGDVLSVIDHARDWADCATVAAALELIGDAGVTSFGHDFTMSNANGGAL